MNLSYFLKTDLFSKRNKIILFSLAVVLVLGIFLPTQEAQAEGLLYWVNPVSWIIEISKAISSTAKGLVNALFIFVFSLLNGIAITILDLARVIFNWVASPNFIGISFTGPDNIIVQEGWSMLRNLANAGLLLGLVFIGLATAFNAAGYNTKKLLLRLLVAALLINFTPVICGAVIDGSNIITNYFLSASNSLSSSWGTLFAQEFKSLSENIIAEPGSVLMKGLVFLSFNLILAFVLLTFAALFVFRYAVLWLLVILSPLAILAWTLGEMSGQVKKIWNQWLQNFINWSIIAIPAAFIIYLADHLLSFAQGHELTQKSTDLEAWSKGFSQVVVEYGLPMILLIAGFFATLSIGATGASAVTGLAKKAASKAGKYGKKGGKKLASLAGRSGARRMAGAATGIKEAKEQATSRIAKDTIAPFKGIAKGIFSGKAADEGIKTWATTKGHFGGYAKRAIGRKVRQSEEGARKARQAKAGKFDLDTNASRYLDAVTDKGKLAIIAQAVEKGQLGKLVKKTGMEGEEAKKIYESAIRLNDNETVKAIERHFAAEIGEDLGKIAENTGHWSKEQQEKDRTEKGYTSYTEKIVGETKDKDDMKQLSNSLGTGKANSEAVMKAIHKSWRGDQIEKAAEISGSKFTRAFRSTSGDWKDYLAVDDNTGEIVNADLAYFRASTAAQKSGLGFSEKVSKKEIDDYVREVSQEVQKLRRIGEKHRDQDGGKASGGKGPTRHSGKFTSSRKRRPGKFDSYRRH